MIALALVCDACGDRGPEVLAEDDSEGESQSVALMSLGSAEGWARHRSSADDPFRNLCPACSRRAFAIRRVRPRPDADNK